MLAVALGACSTPANRRELYNTSYSQSGSWHDYSRRRQAEAVTGISGGTAPSAVTGRNKPGTPSVTPSGTPGPLPPTAVEGNPQSPLGSGAGSTTPALPPSDPTQTPALPTDAGGTAPVTPPTEGLPPTQ